MDVLNWITSNWKNILAFMGALNLIAQTITRANPTAKKGGLTHKAVHIMKRVASLGLHPAEPPDGDDSIPVE